MHSLLKRLFVVLFLTFLLFSPHLVFSDWGSETNPPTTTVTITCGSTTYTATGNIDCGQASATITFAFDKPASSGATGLNTLIYSISGGTATGVLTTAPSGCSNSGSISTGITTTCGGIPRVGSATFAYTVSNATSSFTVSATAKDHAGNEGQATTSGSSFTLAFVKYSIQGAVYIDTDKDGTRDSGENPYTGGSSTIEVRVANSDLCNGALVTSVGTNGTITTSNGTFDTGENLTTGSYHICYKNKPSDYEMTSPQGVPLYRPVTVGPSATDINFGITNSVAWFQGVGGDMRLDQAFTDKLPSGKKAAENGSGGTPGIILTNGSTDFKSGTSSDKRWVVNSSTNPNLTQPPIIRTSYNYLSSLANQTGSTNLSDSYCTNLAACTLPADLPRGVYRASGDLNLNAWSPTATDRNWVFLVSGALRIAGNIDIPVGSTAVFSALRSIIINSSVGQTTYSSTTANIEGFFSAGESFIVEGYTNPCTGTPDRRLNIQGAIVVNAGLGTGKIQNNRDLCGGNPDYPALYIAERVDFILNAPGFIRRTSSVWREVPPGRLASTVDPTPTPTVTPTPTITPTPTTAPTPTPSPTPTLTPTPTPLPVKRVFITSTTSNANLGGLNGADETCTTLARNAGLGAATNWMAWLSDEGTSPALRFPTKNPGPYKLVNSAGTIIANNWTDLIDGVLTARINVDQNSNNQSNKLVWTNTSFNGSGYPNGHCDNWNSSSSSDFGIVGNSDRMNDTWTDYTDSPCSTSTIRLYCFEQ